MEYADRNRATERDLPPEPMGRQSLPEDLLDLGNGGHGNEGQSCPWAAHCEDGWGLGNHPLAMVYAPCQGFHSLYDLDTALVRGTLFSELDLPLEAVGGNRSSVCGGCSRASGKRFE